MPYGEDERALGCDELLGLNVDLPPDLLRLVANGPHFVPGLPREQEGTESEPTRRQSHEPVGKGCSVSEAAAYPPA